jgi:16S rRNA (adenine1518-N6/adenine1519-N6)-dimethyltransferase
MDSSIRNPPTLHQQVREFFSRTGRRPKKRLGQNFLTDSRVLQDIVSAAVLGDDDFVLEIGAGLGFLTSALASHAKRVVAVEIDATLFAELESRFSGYPNVSLIKADILKLDLASMLPDFPPENIKVVANLPYYITTPILWKLLEHHRQLGVCVLMMQMEVAQRIVASPGGKDYGALSIGVAYYAEAEIVRTLSPHQFYPAPQVHSALLKLLIRPKPAVDVENEALFFKIVRAAFQARRKMLRNALLKSGVPISSEALGDVFEQTRIDGRRRGETLSLDEFAALANRLNSALND